MSAPKTLRMYTIYYWQIAELAMNGGLSDETESRFPTPDGVSAETVRARLSAFRTLLRDSHEPRYQAMGTRLTEFAIRASDSEVVLRPKWATKEGREVTLPGYETVLDAARQAKMLSEGRKSVERIQTRLQSSGTRSSTLPESDEMDEIAQRLGMAGIKVTGGTGE
jgi:hypothetical protein